MTTQTPSRSTLALRIARAIALLVLLASGLLTALIFTLAPVIQKAPVVQAAALEVNTQRAMEQAGTAASDETQYICTTDEITVTIVTDTIGFTDCENYSNPPAISLDERGVVFADNGEVIQSVALADVDGDGYLDIATGNSDDRNPAGIYTDLTGTLPSSIRIHINHDGFFTNTTTITQELGLQGPTEVAWGDIDNDGDLDLAVATLQDDFVYVMDDLQVSYTIRLTDSVQEADADYGHSEKRSNSVAWGDVNGDGKLELAVGNYGRAPYSRPITTEQPLEPLSGTIRLYYFDRFETSGTIAISSVSTLTLSIPVTDVAWVTDLAWADYDRDDDLDMIVGIKLSSAADRIATQIYRNEPTQAEGVQFVLAKNLSGTSVSGNTDKSLVAPAYIDANESLDFAITAGRYAFKIVSSLPISPSQKCNFTHVSSRFYGAGTSLQSLTWEDVDGDRDPDLAAGFNNAPDKIYLNQKGCVNPTPVWESELDPDKTSNGTRSLAWGDMDNDGDLDLVAGGSPIGVIYYNDSLSFERVNFPELFHTSSQNGNRAPLGAVALGDIDNDGDLDIARSVYSQPVEILLNDNSSFDTNIAVTDSRSSKSYLGLHFGNIDSDGFLDLFVAAHEQEQVKIYQNHQGDAFIASSFPLIPYTFPNGTALADINNDGVLEILATNTDQLRAYLNNSGSPSRLIKDPAHSFALQDFDNDGDLDIATTIGHGNPNGPTGLKIFTFDQNRVHKGLPMESVFTLTGSTLLFHLAWGDMNGDGSPDLAVATDGYDRVYLNHSGTLQMTPAWTSSIHDRTWQLAWADVDGDGDLDLATGNTTGETTGSLTIYRVYVNRNGLLQRDPVWQSQPISDSTSIAWGDLDDDGVPELVTPGGYYKLNRPTGSDRESGVDQRIAVAIDRFSDPISATSTITALAIANFHAMPFIRQQATIPVTFTLFHPLSQTFDEVRVDYSLNGGGQWFTATGTFNHLQLTSSPFPTRTEQNTHHFDWDVLNSGLFGQYEDVVVRVVAEVGQQKTQGSETVLYTNSVPNISSIPFVSSQTYPFRLRGSQVRVVDENGNGVPNAIAYQIPVGQSVGGNLIGPQGEAFRTDAQGYLSGRGTLEIGDQLLALALQPLPITKTLPNNMSWAKGLTDTIHLYYTNGEPTEIGVDAWISHTNASSSTTSITQRGTQILQVSSKNPLLLFDLRVALEWDASTDPNQVYLSQLRSDLRKAAEFLYDFTNGQATLGNITVTQASEDWAFADIFIQATNRLRPMAVIGGVVVTPTADISSSVELTYTTGQVWMGSTWNRYGVSGQNLGYDWPLALAHELSHYLFFLDDTYLGKNEDDLLIAVDTCKGSVMGDMYDPSEENTEFVADDDKWNQDCDRTFAHELQGTEWAVVQRWYPMLNGSTPLTGPSRMPFNFTNITILPPLNPTQALADPIVYLDYGRNEIVGSPSARGYLIREDKYLFTLGSTVSGQNRLVARGAQPGDQLCVFDTSTNGTYHGCEVVSEADERIALRSAADLTPTITIRPVNTTTINVEVSFGVTLSDPLLQGRLFQEYGEVTQPETFVAQDEGYTATFTSNITFTDKNSSTFILPIIAGHLELWLGEHAENDAAWHTIIPFGVVGDFGIDPAKWAIGPYIRVPGPYIRVPGPYIRVPGPYIRVPGPYQRLGHASAALRESQFTFLPQEDSLDVGELYTLQGADRSPGLPVDTKPIGLIYQLIAVDNDTRLEGSVSFHYLGIDALSIGVTEADEQGLAIYHAQSLTDTWQPIPTTIDTKYNLASAPSAGGGFYALLATVSLPILDSATSQITTEPGQTITLSGVNFASEIHVLLINCASDMGQILDATFISDKELSVTLPEDLPPSTYRLTILMDGRAGANSMTLSIGNAEDENIEQDSCATY